MLNYDELNSGRLRHLIDVFIASNRNRKKTEVSFWFRNIFSSCLLFNFQICGLFRYYLCDLMVSHVKTFHHL